MSFSRKTIAFKTIGNFGVIAQEYTMTIGNKTEVTYGASVIDNESKRTVFSLGMDEMTSEVLSGDIVENVLAIARKSGVSI